MAAITASAAWMVALPAGFGLVLAWWAGSTVVLRRRATRRMYEERGRAGVAPRVVEEQPELWGSWLERWLFVSGFRAPNAVPLFLVLQAFALAAGAGLVFAVGALLPIEVGVQWLEEIPGGVGDFLAPVLSATPWVLFVLVALLPVTRVRARRRDIVQSVERDLPMTLALLATLVESGLGLDAAIERVLRSMDPERALASELRIFRSESQGGVSRNLCFRRLAARLDIPSVSIFVSAMVHSEQVGGGIAQSLRHQSDEVWSRRRERAITRAQMLPTKLAVPLVVCFLPGIFVYTFGPALAQFIRIAEGVVQGNG